MWGELPERILIGIALFIQKRYGKINHVGRGKGKYFPQYGIIIENNGERDILVFVAEDPSP